MSWDVLPWVYPFWDSLGFSDLGDYFLPHSREIFNYYLLKYFLMIFPFVFFFWDSYDSNVAAFNIVLEVSEIVLISFNSFFFFPLWFIYISTILSSISLILFSASVILLLVPFRVFLISGTVLFVSVCLFFSCSRSLLIYSCIFSILFQDFKKKIIFTIIILNSFSGSCLFPPHLLGLLCFYFVPSFV